jgi:cytochrome c biogenesis protein CcdA/thiol-disulfide isomerase/thioredoxin
MILLLGAAFIVGVLTTLTPCVLPVLPIVLAGGSTGTRRRPLAIVAGLVTSFTLFTLFWTAILDALPLPADLLRNMAIGVIALTAVSLVVPRVAELAQRPFQRLTRIQPNPDRGSFLLGLALGLVFTPCAGLLIGSVAAAAATQKYSLSLVVVVLTYSLGVAASLLAIMFAARRGMAFAPVRRAAPRIRQGLGVAMAATVVVMILGLDARLASRVPDVLDQALAVQDNDSVARELGDLTKAKGIGAKASADKPAPPPKKEKAAVEENPEAAFARTLPDYGPAPEFARLDGWINGDARSLNSLRGKVVVIDFWTYSCVNCLRTIPHLQKWHEAYKNEGLVLVGVHTPEFAFEADRANVEDAVGDLGVTWPVALDNRYGTWSAWGNQYWPAKYFIGRNGHVRHAHFGEGEYHESEQVIRALLAEDAPAEVALPAATSTPAEVTDRSPRTPETYLGYQRNETIAQGDQRDNEADYTFPSRRLREDEVALDGRWRVDKERSTATRDARLRLRFRGRAVHLVLGTENTGGNEVEVLVDGRRVRTVTVTEHKLYTLAEPKDDEFHDLELRFAPGVSAYAFTFGRLAV